MWKPFLLKTRHLVHRFKRTRLTAVIGQTGFFMTVLIV